MAAASAVPPPAHAAATIAAFKSQNYEQIVARPNFASASGGAVQTPTSKQQRSRRVRVLTASGVVLGTTVVGVGNLKRKQQQQSKDEEEEEEKQREEARESSSPKEPRDADDVDPQAVVTKKSFRLPEEMQIDNVKKEDNGNGNVDVDADEASNKSRYQATLEKLIRNSQAEHSQVPRVLLGNNKRKKKLEAAEDTDDSDPSSGISDNNDNTPAPSAAARTVDFASAKAKIAQFFPSKASNPNTNTRDDDEKEPTTATAVLGSTQPPLTPTSSVVTANIATATTNTASSISTTKSLAPVYSSVGQARQQPKPPTEESKLQARYAAMDNPQDRAFQILVDLGMVELTSSADSDDDEWQ